MAYNLHEPYEHQQVLLPAPLPPPRCTCTPVPGVMPTPPCPACRGESPTGLWRKRVFPAKRHGTLAWHQELLQAQERLEAALDRRCHDTTLPKAVRTDLYIRRNNLRRSIKRRRMEIARLLGEAAERAVHGE